MDGVEAGTRMDRASLDHATRAAAERIGRSMLDAYGPSGGHRLVVDGDDGSIHSSGATALRDGPDDATSRPFSDLAASVLSTVGDQATMATALACLLVRRGLDATADGIGRAKVLDGLQLAERQVLATLRSSVNDAPASEVLAHCTSLGMEAAAALVEGLSTWGRDMDGRLPLDDVDIRTESIDAPEWSDGTIIEPQHFPEPGHAPDVGVLLLTDGWRIKPRSSGLTRRIRDVRDHAIALDAEAGMRRDIQATIDALRVGLVVAGGAMDDVLVDRLVRSGTFVWTDAPKDAMRRLAACTGATAVPRPQEADASAIGRADIRPRPGRRDGFTVHGPGPSATFILPAVTGPASKAVVMDGERLLRAAGAVLDQAGSLPGGGRWQRIAADSLRSAADHAPGKAALVVADVKRCFDDLADALVRNAGFDPLSVRLLRDADDVIDPAACVLHAVRSAFATARTVLRIDGQHARRPSTAEGLKGSSQDPQTLRGMAGDVPPLM